jgi:hypothetical protein
VIAFLAPWQQVIYEAKATKYFNGICVNAQHHDVDNARNPVPADCQLEAKLTANRAGATAEWEPPIQITCHFITVQSRLRQQLRSTQTSSYARGTR